MTELTYIPDDCEMQFGTVTDVAMEICNIFSRCLSAEQILASISTAKEELDAPPTIKVWVGEDSWMPRSEYPRIQESPHLTEDTCYVMAGVGIIAGKKAYKRIWELGYIAVWDENPQEYNDPLHRN